MMRKLSDFSELTNNELQKLSGGKKVHIKVKKLYVLLAPVPGIPFIII